MAYGGRQEARRGLARLRRDNASGSLRRRFWVRAALLATLVAVAGVVTVLAVAGGGGAGQAARDRQAEGRDRRAEREVAKVLAGIPQEGNTLGRPGAPITLQIFGDLECTSVRLWMLNVLPTVIRKFVRTGVMRIQYRSMKTDTISPRTFVNQQTAALAAGQQQRMWDFILTFYLEQGTEYTPYATDSYLDGLASQIPGMNLAQWHHDRAGGRRSERVVADDQAARALGFRDTPAFQIGRTAGAMVRFKQRREKLRPGQIYVGSLISPEDIQNAINRLD
jgi:protein-disulfide isomerase